MMVGRTILHVDMDAFYASVEQRDRPALRGKPVIVGAAPGQRGVVCAASYAARAFGVRSAMPTRTAARLCPEGVFLPVRMAHYVAVSEQLQTILDSFTPLVEPLALDEAFLDVTGALHGWGSGEAMARVLKERIQATLQLPCSVGVASNKFLAKLASDLDKPDGLCVVPSEPAAIRAFLAPLLVSRIWGVGPVMEKRLASAGIRTIGDLQACAPDRLTRLTRSAEAAAHLAALAVGLDDRPVDPDAERKSISRERTFSEDCTDEAVLHQVLLELTEEVGYRLRRAGRYAGCVTVKWRTSRFKTVTRQQATAGAVSSDHALWQAASALWAAQAVAEPVRLLGFGVSRLSEDPNAPAGGAVQQPELFDVGSPDPEDARQQRLDAVVDRLREQYGTAALRRGNWRVTQAEDEEEEGS
jgi:DNA polymerase IV